MLYLVAKALLLALIALAAWAIVSLLLTILRYVSRNRYYSGQDIPKLPSAVSILDFFATDGSLEKILDRKHWFNEDGSVKDVVHAGAYIDGTPLLCFSNPADIKALLVEENYPKLPISYEAIELFLGKGLVTSTGAFWKKQRRLITPSFTFQQLHLMSHTMVEVGQNMVARISGFSHPIDITDFFSQVTMEVIVHCAFSGLIDSAEMTENWKQANQAFNLFFPMQVLLGKALNDNFPFPWSRKLFNSIKAVKQQVKDAIDERKSTLTPEDAGKDLLTALLLAEDSDGSKMNEQQIIDECLTFLFAGHDTTSSLMSWCCIELSRNPDIMLKAQEEVDSVLGTEVPSHTDFNKLQFCKDILFETLRMHAPVPMIERLIPSDQKISGVDVSAGTYAFVMFVNPSRDPAHWEDPDTFNPSRWQTEKVRNRNPYAFTPFSAGSRNCVGQKFSILEAVMLLSLLLQNFDIEPVSQPFTAAFEGTMKPVGAKVLFCERVQNLGENPISNSNE